jgi:hypothetical protein
MGLLSECFGTMLTPKRLFPCVRPQVHLDVGLVEERPVALGTVVHHLSVGVSATRNAIDAIDTTRVNPVDTTVAAAVVAVVVVVVVVVHLWPHLLVGFHGTGSSATSPTHLA